MRISLTVLTTSAFFVPAGGVHVVRMQLLDFGGQASIIACAGFVVGVKTKAVAAPNAALVNSSRRREEEEEDDDDAVGGW